MAGKTVDQICEQLIHDMDSWTPEDKAELREQLLREFRGPRRWQDQEFPAKKNQCH